MANKPLFSQNTWKFGNTVISQTSSNWIEGAKIISVYKIVNNDTLITNKETYDINGNRLTFMEFNEETGKMFISVKYTYENGRLIEIIHRNNKYKRYYYEDEQIVRAKTWSYNTDTSFVNYYYNEEKELVKLVSGDSSEVYFEYNSDHQILKSLSKERVFEVFEYDTNGNLIKEFNPETVLDKSYLYDDKNRLIEFRIHDDPNTFAARRVYLYDDKDKLIELKEYNDKRLFKTIKYIYEEQGKKTLIYYKRVKKKADDMYVERYQYFE